MAAFFLITAGVSLILAIILHRVLIRRSFQSLRLPPGPKPWPIIGNLPHLGKVPHHSLAAMAREYGPLIYLRLGYVDVVVASSASVAEQFLKFQDANFLNRPRNAGSKHIGYNHQDLVFAPYGPRWRMFRKISAVYMFSTKALEDNRSVREEEVAMLVRTIERAGQVPVKLGSLLNVCVTNALARVILGRRVVGSGGGSNDSRADEFKYMVVEAMTLSGEFSIDDFIPALEWLDLQGLTSKMKKIHNWFDRFLTNVLEERRMMAGGGGGDNHLRDLLGALLALKDQAEDENDKLRDTEIKGFLLNMFLAGTDTSSSTVEWAIAELIRNPKILAQVQQELDSVVGCDRLVSELDLPNLTYLQAVVKEIFRLHPSTPLSVPRMASESCQINGYHIPKNCTLLVNVWAIARDPIQWSDPLEFRPERFLAGGEKADVDVKGNDFEVIPFGAGRRICAGMSLGMRMVQLLTATLAHAFTWELPDGLSIEKLSMDEAFGLTLQRAQPLVVHPQPRLPYQVYEGLQSCDLPN